MNDGPVDSEYFIWLCAKVMRVEVPTPSNTWWNLLRDLYNTEFIWVEPMDENRAEDGCELRTEFLGQVGWSTDPEWLRLGCSVLEMLIAFSRRASFQTGRSAKNWFWEMIDNLGLKKFNDAVADPFSDIPNTLERFLWRTYEPDGTGGLFPLKNNINDQRKVEIWHQFCDYLVD
jgi:hypothetical protein